ncbi:MAG TPA: hypothetical protein VI758_12335 [Bacteroidota bacterium]
MKRNIDNEILTTLKKIHEGQQQIIKVLSAQHGTVEELAKQSRETVEESLGLQRTALRRQRTIGIVAVPGIVACIVAILYLVLRYL